MTTLQLNIPDNLQQQAMAVFEAVGMSTDEAVRIFFQQTVNSGGIPFSIKAKQPNATTRKAMRDVEEGKVTRYNDTKEFYKDLGIEILPE
jgi:DNA-damage-inducible protein J